MHFRTPLDRSALFFLTISAACGETIEPLDGGAFGTDAHPAGDAGPIDGGGAPDAVPTDAEAIDAGTPCEGPSGTFHDQRLGSGGEDRFYFLHVPAEYRCDRPWPIWIDLHGTATPPLPEEAYALDALMETADREGIIAVRPRSRSSLEGGQQVFRWDQNPGDLQKNAAFVRELLEDLRRRYHLDPARRYVSGFSSGTNMAAQFLADTPATFQGFGFIAGGAWSAPALSSVPAETRVYFASGYKDYLHSAQRDLIDDLTTAGLSADRFFVREMDGGHDLFGWQLAEMLPWLDRLERPAAGTLSAAWTRDPTSSTSASLLELARSTSGDLYATTAAGSLWHRQGRVSTVTTLANGVPLPALCGPIPGATDRILASGETHLWIGDGASWREAPPIPEPFGQFFGASYLLALDCTPAGRVLGAGYWTGVLSDDRGGSWSGSAMMYPGVNVPAQVASVRIGTASVAVAAGNYYLGRSDDGVTFSEVTPPRYVGWLYDLAFVAPDRWWVAGTGGAIFSSEDDGRTWVDRSPAGVTDDLYAIDFWDADHGITVGLHGRALHTEDGGQTWDDVSIGLDRYLGDVSFTSQRTMVAVGEGGLVLELAR